MSNSAFNQTLLALPITVANGGTGQTTTSAAINTLIPDQTGNSGKFLTTNATAVSWGTPSASVAWGGITGTLSNQIDLQSALDGKQPLDADLTALAGLASATDKLPYFTGSSAAALADFTSAGRALLDDANATAQIATLGLDADIATLSLPASTTISSFGASLVDDADASSARTTLGLGTLATQSGTFSGTSSGTNTGDQTLSGLGGAPNSSQFVTLATDANLTVERVLTGTSNQITVTDNGAGSTVVLSAPQNIHTAASPSFAGLSLGTGALNTVGNIEIDGTTARDITVGSNTDGNAGNTLIVSAGSVLSGGTSTNLVGGELRLKTGAGTGSNGNAILTFYTSTAGSTGTAAQTVSEKMRILSSSNGRMLIGATSNSSGSIADGLTLGGNVARGLEVNRHPTNNTAGNNLTVRSGGASPTSTTDKAAGDLILTTGLSVGTGASKVRIQTCTTALSTGSSDNTATDRIIVTSPKSVTNNSATTVLSLTNANSGVVAGVIHYCIEVTDGTDYQVEEGQITYHVTNKAGAIANNTVVKSGNQQAMTGGTLTVTFTITAADPALVQINANSSLTPSTGYPRVTMVVKNLTQQVVTVS